MLGLAGLVKERPTQLLIERLEKLAAQPAGGGHKRRDGGWLALKRENRAFLSGGALAIFASHVFPGHHEGRDWVPRPHAPEGMHLDAPAADEPSAPIEVRCGAWKVRLSRVASSASTAPASAVDTRSHEGNAAPAESDAKSDAESDPALHAGSTAPAIVWAIVSGHVCYTLPGCSAYTIGSSTHAEVDALRELRGEVWGVMVGSLPQVICAGEPLGGDVRVEIDCMRDARIDADAEGRGGADA